MKIETKTIRIEHLHAFEGHPFYVRNDEEMDRLIESVREYGILIPLIVRPLDETEYEIISGHRRVFAAKRAGVNEIPAHVYAVDRDEAAILLVDSNLQREHIFPSEKAFAYKLKLDAMNRQGQRTFSQDGKRLNSYEEMAEQIGQSRNQIHRYIRLTNLIPDLLCLMDEGKVALTVGVELSYLSEPEQKALAEAIALYDCTPSYSQACRMRKESENSGLALTQEYMEQILSEEKPNQRERVSFRCSELRKYFPQDYTPKQISDAILRLIESNYQRQLRERRDRDDR